MFKLLIEVMTIFVMLSLPLKVEALNSCQILFSASNKKSAVFEELKTLAAQDAVKISKLIINHPDLTNAEVFELAKIAAAKSSSNTSLYIQNYKGLTNQQLFEVAKIAAAQHDGYGISAYIQNYIGLTNAQIFEVAKIVAAESGHVISVYIKNYKGLTNLQLFEVAKIAAAQPHAYGISAYIQNYIGLTNQQLFEVAKIAAAENATGVSEYIQSYKGLTNQQLFEVAKIAAAQPNHGYGISAYIQNYIGLTNLQLFEVVKIAVADYATGASEYIQNYKGLTNHQLFEVAKIVAAENGLEISVHINNYKGLTDSQIFVIYKIAIAQSPVEKVVNNFSHILTDYSLLRRFQLLSPFSETQKKDISKIQQWSELKKYFLTSEIPSSVTEAQFHQITNLAWDRIQKRETGLFIVNEALRLAIRKKPIPATSLELISQVSGLKLLTLLPAKTSNDTLGKIYELIMDIQENIYKPFFSKIIIPDSTYKNPSELITLLTVVRDLKSIQGNNRQAALETLNILKPLNDSKDNQNITEQLKSLVVTKFQELLNTKDTQLQYQDLKALEESWGDLKPIFTLVARFKGNSKWRPLILELSKVFTASINKEFSKFKFSGEAKNQADQMKANTQLKGLSEAEKIEWERPRALVQIAKSNQALSEQAILAVVHANFKDNLLVHLNFKSLTQASFSRDLGGLSEFILEQRISPKDVYNRILEKYSLNPQINSVLSSAYNSKILTTLLSEFTSQKLENVSKLIEFMDFLLKKDPTLVEINQKEQVASDLRSIKDLASSYKTQSQGTAGLILTVLNSDPKFLITIGDRVNTSSCQNYRTGSHIETLLGYVMDANLQALVSFELNEARFASATDFTKVQNAYRYNQRVQVEFNGNKMIATFTLLSGEVISTKILDYAHLRQIIKLGTNTETEQSALFLEREYLQTHPNLLQMRDQHQQLFQELLTATGSTDKGPIKIEASRSQGGQYSDAAGGANINEYIIPK